MHHTLALYPFWPCSIYILQLYSTNSALTNGQVSLSQWHQWSMVVDPATSWNLNLWVNNNASYIANIWFIGFALFMVRYLLAYGWLLFQVSKASDYSLPDIDLNRMLFAMKIKKKSV